MTYIVSGGTLNPTHSLIHSLWTDGNKNVLGLMAIKSKTAVNLSTNWTKYRDTLSCSVQFSVGLTITISNSDDDADGRTLCHVIFSSYQ